MDQAGHTKTSLGNSTGMNSVPRGVEFIQRVQWWLPGPGQGNGERLSGGVGAPVGDVRKFRRGLWGQLHNRVNVLSVTDLHPSKWLKSPILCCIYLTTHTFP